MWTVYFGRLFDEWFEEQELALKRKVLAELKHLEEFGPSLSRPHADTVKGHSLHLIQLDKQSFFALATKVMIRNFTTE